MSCFEMFGAIVAAGVALAVLAILAQVAIVIVAAAVIAWAETYGRNSSDT